MRFTANWHRQSWEDLLWRRLPELLGDVVPLADYQVMLGDETCRIDLAVDRGDDGHVATSFENIVVPDERGIFWPLTNPTVVVPMAATERLDNVRCAGELFAEFIEERLRPVGLRELSDQAAVQAWLRLDEWIVEFFEEMGQRLDTQNPAAEQTHVYRVVVERISDVSHPDQIGRTCPVETPEGPRIGTVLTIATGAEIAEGEVRVREDGNGSPSDLVGPSASCIPFLGRSDPARALMGANMMRQWMPPLEGEAALVRTGNEPDDPDFWCGYNLLTAYMNYGRGNLEDGIIFSESAAARMQYDEAVAVGDKFSTRHGNKGVVSRIVPDEAMPRTGDGTVVECLVGFAGLHTRMNTGELWEAIYGRLVAAGALDPVVPQFGEPGRDALAKELAAAGLPEDGLERLTIPEEDAGQPEVVIGPVYWGRTVHRATTKLSFGESGAPFQLSGEMEYYALAACDCHASIREVTGFKTPDDRLADGVWEALEAGEAPRMSAATSATALETKLRAMGIIAGLGDDGYRFAFDPVATGAESDRADQAGRLAFPEPIAHPWRPSSTIESLPENPETAVWNRLTRAVERLRKLRESDAPVSLTESSRDALGALMQDYGREVLGHHDLVPRGKVPFSGRSVIVPGEGLGVDEIGLPERLSWALFGPLVTARMGRGTDQAEPEARAALKEVMARRWVRMNRAPTLAATAMLGFRPRLVSHDAIELHPMLCQWIDGDFDGDQVAVFHPLTEGAQDDARERLSVTGHLRRDPGLIGGLVPAHESMWGLAALSLRESGREEIVALTGPLPSARVLTRAQLAIWAQGFLAREGTERSLTVLEALFELGLREARRAARPFNPFMGVLGEPVATGGGERARSLVEEGFAGSHAFDDPGVGSQLLLVASGARGQMSNLVHLTWSRAVDTVSGRTETTSGYLDGVAVAEYCELALSVRRNVARVIGAISDRAAPFNELHYPTGGDVLDRATRAAHPGVVMAAAAARREVDPLDSAHARALLGLPPVSA